MLTFFYCLNQFKTHLQNQTGSNSIIDTDFYKGYFINSKTHFVGKTNKTE